MKQGNVLFCGFCDLGNEEGFSRRIERSLEEMEIPATGFSIGPLRLWTAGEGSGSLKRTVSSRGLALSAGELLCKDEEGPPRGLGELESLLDWAVACQPERLAGANGSFAALAWDAAGERLWLLADALGSRPLYFCEVEGRLFFSTHLEILLKAEPTPTAFDFGAFIEQEAFCYPLGDLTLYRGIRLLRDSEYLIWEAGRTVRARYFDWSRIPFHSLPLEEAASRCAAALGAAVRDRMPPDGQPARILLSGGLDSRCVAALLHQAGCQLEPATLLVEGSLDTACAVRLASSVNLPLRQISWDPADIPSVIGHRTRAVLLAGASAFPQGRVFTGDGGGETLGFLMMGPEVMSLLGQGRTVEAVRLYTHNHGASPAMFRQPWRRIAETRPREAMASALRRLAHLPEQKAFQLFLLTNDLRRHLHDAWEAASLAGYELVTPFLDRRVLHAVLSLAPPLEPFLGHRLYHEVLRHLPEQFFRVPWQTYPGHQPCPVQDSAPAGQALASQWELNRALAGRTRSILRGRAIRHILRRKVPGRLVRLPWLCLNIAAHLVQLTSSSHWFRVADALACAWRPGLDLSAGDEALD